MWVLDQIYGFGFDFRGLWLENHPWHAFKRDKSQSDHEYNLLEHIAPDEEVVSLVVVQNQILKRLVRIVKEVFDQEIVGIGDATGCDSWHDDHEAKFLPAFILEYYV